MIFPTLISGIPCQCNVTSYSEYVPWKQHVFPGAGPGDCDPPEEGEFEFTILNMNGNEDSELQDQISDEDTIRLEKEYIEFLGSFDDY